MNAVASPNSSSPATISSTIEPLAGLAARYTFTMAENDLWTFLGVNTIGTNHATAGTPCEDAFHLTAHKDAVIAVVADGVGDPKAARSGEGARLSVQLAAAAIARGIDAGVDLPQAISEAFSHVHNALVGRTKQEGAYWGTYACTLAAAVIRGAVITVAHIGDSNAFHFDGKRLTRVATARVNDSPTIIVLPDWRNDFAVQVINKPYVKAFALTTDGCGNFFMGRETDDASQTNPRLTAMLLDHMRENPSPYHALAGINALLQAKDYDSGDDRTMFWAFRKEKAA